MKNYLDDILAISGQPGLFKLISNAQGKNNIIVESLNTGKRIPIFSTTSVSQLKEVLMYTSDADDVPLNKIFENLFKKYDGNNLSNAKITNQELKDFMENGLPNYDKDRVYVSDMKKLFNWYNILIEQKILTNEAIELSKKEEEVSTEDIKEN